MEVHILDRSISNGVIRERRRLGIDSHDEVWDGVYVVSRFASNPHQTIVTRLVRILGIVVEDSGRGIALAGANVSDHQGQEWKKSHRTPDVVVVLNGGRAVDCGTHWYGGPDFLVEVQSPGDKTNAKIPFYAALGVRELLIVQRDSRQLRLYCRDGAGFDLVEPDGKRWLTSAVVPLSFRRATTGRKSRTEVRRTDGTAGRWVF